MQSQPRRYCISNNYLLLKQYTGKESPPALLIRVSQYQKEGEVWIENSLCPSGPISNPANNCWANAVLQCMLNSSFFMEVISEQILSHPASCSINCNHSGKPNPYIQSFSLIGTCTYTYTRQHLCDSSDKKNGTIL